MRYVILVLMVFLVACTQQRIYAKPVPVSNISETVVEENTLQDESENTSGETPAEEVNTISPQVVACNELLTRLQETLEDEQEELDDLKEDFAHAEEKYEDILDIGAELERNQTREEITLIEDAIERQDFTVKNAQRKYNLQEKECEEFANA